MLLNLDKLKTLTFRQGLALLCVLWSLYFLISPDSDLPSLEADYSKDIKQLPKFSDIKNTTEKKKAFFNFLYPIIEKENTFLLNIRQQLLLLEEKINNAPLNSEEHQWLTELGSDYQVELEDTQALIKELLVRVNTVPPSLVLAQAAIESGWGSSRFARKANNLFGHWCFEKGCGLVPKRRDDGRHHEVAKFDSVNASIRAYLKNLNSFHRYEKFRQLRQEQIQQTKHQTIETLTLIPGLMAYSELGPRYLTKVRKMIKQNKLIKFDQKFYSVKPQI